MEKNNALVKFGALLAQKLAEQSQSSLLKKEEFLKRAQKLQEKIKNYKPDNATKF